MGQKQPAGTIANFDGINNVVGYLPSDENGATGPNHYVQTVNSSYSIYSKTGTKLLGPLDLGVLWVNLPGPWSSSLNDGDPIVLYDKVADRWLISEFSLPQYPDGPYYELVAISATGNPLGQYYLYGFTFDKMPDYPHFGVWTDGYYLSVNLYEKTPSNSDLTFAGVRVCSLERDSMLAGKPARMIEFSFGPNDPVYSFLPSDFDGPQPAAGSPNYFCYIYDNSWGITNDVLGVYAFHTDWRVPANSTFTSAATFNVNSFSSSGISVSQPGTNVKLDELSDRLLHRLQYRKFSDHEAIVANHTVSVGGHAGIRWYELRKTTGSWTLHQQGTYSPTNDSRWMASIAMNSEGTIALGYSVSSSTVYPSIKYTGRLSSDPLGVMSFAEGTIMTGNGSQLDNSGRWGDYTSMTIDPTDDKTFWYTDEYYSSSSNAAWKTRIASFQLGTTQTGPCLAANPSAINAVPQPGTYDVTVSTTCGGSLAWFASTDASWITVNAVSMSQLQIQTAANTGTQSRTGTVTITQSGATNSPLTINVTQAGTNSTATITGIVKNAITNTVLSGVTVGVGTNTTTTDQSGRYALYNVPISMLTAAFTGNPTAGNSPLTVQFTDNSSDNNITLTASKQDYVTYTNNQITLQLGETKVIDIALSPVITGEGLRFVLNWGERPWDLDSHLKTPLIEGQYYHVDFMDPGDSIAPPYATLDVDNVDGFGPETITIKKFYNGVYYYFVHNYSGEVESDTSFKNSNAIVQVYNKDGLLNTIKCPSTGEGYFWHVCNVDGATKAITVINTVTTVEPGYTTAARETKLKPRKIHPSVVSNKKPSNVNSWYWEFGDNTTSTTQNPSHTYQASGSYTVKLTVSNGSSQKTLTKDNYIVVSPPQPVNRTISGTVLYSNQSPVEGVKLSYLLNGILSSVTTGTSGTYAIVVPNGWSGIVTPSKTGYTFIPTERNYTSISADATAQNYLCSPETNLPNIVPVVPVTVNAGSELWVDITVGNNAPVSNLFGVSLELNYLKTYLTYVSAEPGAFMGTSSDVIFLANNDASTGKVSIGVTRKSPATGANGTGIVIRVKFNVAPATPNNTTAGFTLTNVSATNPSGGAVALLPVAASTNIITGLFVWPGDTNNDGIVNQADVLPIGINWALTGAVRTNASSSWTAQSCAAWTPSTATYVDANGDGVINQADVMPIGINWNKTHAVGYTNQPVSIAQGIFKVGNITRNDKELSINLHLEMSDNTIKNIAGISLAADFSTSPKTTDVQVIAGGYFNGTLISFSRLDADIMKAYFGTSLVQKQTERNIANPIITLKIKQSDLKGNAIINLKEICIIDEAGNYYKLNDYNVNLSVNAILDKENVSTYSLVQNYPNPFNPSTVIEYTMPGASNVILKVYNALGQEIQTLVNQYQSAGKHRVEFNAANLPSGIYIYRITTGSYTELRKMILQK